MEVGPSRNESPSTSIPLKDGEPEGRLKTDSSMAFNLRQLALPIGKLHFLHFSTYPSATGASNLLSKPTGQSRKGWELKTVYR
jgi:hypothetical protein